MSVTDRTAIDDAMLTASDDAALTASDDAAIATEMSYELDRLQASIARRLGLAGIELTDAERTAVVDGILNDAVRVALLWLGERGGSSAPGHPPDARRTGQLMPSSW